MRTLFKMTEVTRISFSHRVQYTCKEIKKVCLQTLYLYYSIVRLLLIHYHVLSYSYK